MNKLNKVSQGYGVFEWASYSYNIGTGCINDCRYCYAREIAVRTGQITDGAAWCTERVKPHRSAIHESVNDIVMFPSMHDISENYLPTYLTTLGNLLAAGNPVVIVTKPRLASIQAICKTFPQQKDRMLFRMTITSLDERLSRFWEPGAPLPDERLSALRYAYEAGFQTSVSVEPLLDTVTNAVTLYQSLTPYITEDIWFGKMNGIRGRVDMSRAEVTAEVDTILRNQTDENILWLYRQLNDLPKIKWKDSIREVVKKAQLP
jgi:DNA repair photolyase